LCLEREERKLTRREDAQVETHSIVLVGDKEEQAVAQDGPDHDVGQDSSRGRVCIDSGSTDSKQKNVVQSQRTRHDRNVDESRCSRVSEIKRREIEKVDDQKHLGEPKVRATPQMSKAEQEQVVEDKVASYICGSLDVDWILRVQVPAVANLQDGQDDDVDGGDDRVEGEWRVMVRVLVPDGASVVLALTRRIERVVDAGNNKQEP
jgi:hypothetical protein